MPQLSHGRISLLVTLYLYAFWSISSSADSPPPIAREFRGVWVATVANIDWPSKPGLSTAEQRSELVTLLDRAAELHLNAVIFQVRPAADALYKSELEPWSEFLTGEMGTAPEPFYDPLAFAIDEAHRRGLELHAWFNPFRARHPSEKGNVSPSHISQTQPEIVRTYGKHLWLDPGEPLAREHSLAVMLDVVRRYDIDGVHLDDYFYPYAIKDDDGQEVPFPDEESWQKRSEKNIARNDWRRQNVDQLIQQLYSQVKSAKPWVKVGISPFGIWRPGYPASIRGFDAYDKLYADSRKWQQQGWLDYLSPQLYWKIDSLGQSYPVLLEWWHEQNLADRHLWPGNFTSKVGLNDDWSPEEIVKQIELTRQQDALGGNVHFSMKAFLRDYGGINAQLSSGLYAQPALVPSSAWLNDDQPEAPQSSLDEAGRLSLTMPNGPAPWQWTIQWKQGNDWQAKILAGNQSQFELPENATDVVVTSVSRTGIQSDPVQVRESR